MPPNGPSNLLRAAGPSFGRIPVSILICAISTVASWFVVTQLAIWFGYPGLAMSIPIVIGIALLVWLKTRYGIAWAVGSAIGAIPSFVFFWFFFFF